MRCVFQDVGETNEIAVPGIIQANTPYHVVVTAGPAGFEMWLNGQHVGTNPDFGGAWAANPVSIEIGSVFFSANRMNGIIDEIALYDRVIEDARSSR